MKKLFKILLKMFWEEEKRLYFCDAIKANAFGRCRKAP